MSTDKKTFEQYAKENEMTFSKSQLDRAKVFESNTKNLILAHLLNTEDIVLNQREQISLLKNEIENLTSQKS